MDTQCSSSIILAFTIDAYLALIWITSTLLVCRLPRQDLIHAATQEPTPIPPLPKPEWTNEYLAGYNAEARNHASADSVRWQRKGVPLHIVQSQGPMERTLTDIVALAKVLYQEEQKAFHAAMAESADRCGRTASQFCTSTHTRTLVAKQASRAQPVACMHASTVQTIFSIIIAVTVASWETIKNKPCCCCIELTADWPPDESHQLKDVRHATPPNRCA